MTIYTIPAAESNGIYVDAVVGRHYSSHEWPSSWDRLDLSGIRTPLENVGSFLVTAVVIVVLVIMAIVVIVGILFLPNK